MPALSTPALRMAQLRVGPDYRLTKGDTRGNGRVSFSPFSQQIDNPFAAIPSDFLPDPLSGLVKLFITDSPPFSADDQGNAFPIGQLWACTTGAAVMQVAKLPGTATPQTSGLFSFAKPTRNQWLMYRAQGIKAAATGTIKLQQHTSGTVLSTKTVHGSDGPNQTIPFDVFAGFTDDTVDVIADWGASTGDIPPIQIIVTHPLANEVYTAIPTTLPTGYTARIAGNFQYQMSDARDLVSGLPRPGPYRTAENAEMIEPFLGCEQGEFLWIAGEPWVYEWLPEAVDQASFLAAATANPDITFHIPFPPPDGSDITIPGVITNASVSTHGLRSWSLFIQSQDGFGVPTPTGGAGYTVDVVRTDTRATLVSHTYGEAELLAGQTVTGATVVNATLGDDVTITVTLTRSGSPHNTAAIVFAWFRGAFRCDVPLPYSITGASQVVGGGYLPSKRAAPPYANDNTLERLAAGVTSYTPPQFGKPVAFIIGSNGWYRVTQDAADLTGVGEFEFGYDERQQAERGHAGRSFYAFASSTTAMALATYSPSFGAIASGGTTKALTTQGVWAFGSIALPHAGTFKISILPTDKDGVLSGLVFEWSATDATCLTTDGIRRWKSMDILRDNSEAKWAGTASTPPAPSGTPGIRDAWIVGASPTGAFVGHENEVAVWDEVALGWRFYLPRPAAYLFNAAGDDWTWYDGQAWMASTDPVLEVVVTVDAATSIACTLRRYTSARGVTTPHYKVRWATA